MGSQSTDKRMSGFGYVCLLSLVRPTFQCYPLEVWKDAVPFCNTGKSLVTTGKNHSQGMVIEVSNPSAEDV